MTAPCPECGKAFRDGDRITADARVAPPIIRHNACADGRIGPVVNGERFAPGYDERTALYEQHMRLRCRPDCEEEHYQLAFGF
jgi:hypothetical protein